MSNIQKDALLRQAQEQICDSITLANKGVASKYMKFCDSEGLSFEDKGVVADLLNNYVKVTDSADVISSDFGPYVMEVLPLITAWYPTFPLKDLICVETIKQPLGYLFFSELKANDNKGSQLIGDKVETPLGMRKLKGKYPTGEIYGETIENAQISSQTHDSVVAYYPLKVSASTQTPGADWLKKYKAVVTVSDNSRTYSNATLASGVVTLYDTATGATGYITINVTTGIIDFSHATAVPAAADDKAVVNYVWDVDTADQDNIPSIKETISKVMIEAQPRVLSMEWTIFSEYLKKSQFGSDIRESNTKRMLNLLYQFQVRYILDDLFENSVGDGDEVHHNIVIPGSTSISLDVKANTVMQALKVVANRIEKSSGRIEGNRIVCGSNLKQFMESLPDTWFKASPNVNDGKYGFSAAREIGTFGTFKVYYDPNLEAAQGFMTYKGSEWYDGVYYLAEYMPVVPTEAVALGVTVRKAFCSMEAYYYHKPECVEKLNVTYAQ